MKAQLTLEYYISLTIFILFVAYLFFQVIVISPQFMKEIKSEVLKSEGYQISEILINDPGQPIDWTQENVKRIGLSSNVNKTNFLSASKIGILNTMCNSDYENVRKLIDTEYYFSINMTDRVTGEKIIDCEPPVAVVNQMKISVSRIVAMDSGNFGELNIQLW